MQHYPRTRPPPAAPSHARRHSHKAVPCKGMSRRACARSAASGAVQGGAPGHTHTPPCARSKVGEVGPPSANAEKGRAVGDLQKGKNPEGRGPLVCVVGGKMGQEQFKNTQRRQRARNHVNIVVNKPRQRVRWRQDGRAAAGRALLGASAAAGGRRGKSDTRGRPRQ